MSEYPYRPKTMRMHDYQKLALCTAPNPDPRTISPMDDQVFHGAIGLCGEIGEIYQSENKGNMAEEIGDCLWYIAIALHGAGYDMEDMEYSSVEINDPFFDLVIYSSMVADQAKRLVYYQAPLAHPFIVGIRSCLACLDELSEPTGFTMEEIMEKNIEKLKIRYPHKYSHESAIQRDTRKESKVFES